MHRLSTVLALPACILTMLAMTSNCFAQSPLSDLPLRGQSEAKQNASTEVPEVAKLLGKGRGSAHFPFEFRAMDETNNNKRHPEWGSASTELMRMCTVAYADGVEQPSQAQCPSPRAISNACIAQSGNIPNSRNLSDLFWQWGQFLDHDTDLVAVIKPLQSFDIPVPTGDPYFDPNSTGTAVIELDRSFYNMTEGVRQQVNEITSYIDASNVYGSDAVRGHALRTMDGTGRLKTSEGNLLPYNTEGLSNAPSTDPSFFVAGDTRANEQVYLTAMHTLFMREHNWWADRIHKLFRRASDETVYQYARALVAAEIQSITFNEFLPILLGPHALNPYTGYKPNVNAGIRNEFASAAFRVGHTMLSNELKRVDAQFQTIPEGSLMLADAFFSPQKIATIGIEPYLRGQASQVAQEVDNHVVDGVRNFLFGPPGAGGFDLPSLNIQRARDHGLPGYNQVRADLGLEPATSFADVSPDPEVQAALASVYNSVDDIDLWVGGLCEEHVPGAMIGPTFWTIIKRQFEALRDGDRFWYQSYLPPVLVRMVESRTLAKIIRANTTIGDELQDNVFVVPPSWL